MVAFRSTYKEFCELCPGGLRNISEGQKITIPETDGRETIVRSSNVFKEFQGEWSVWNFEEKKDETRLIPQTDVFVYELAKDAVYLNMFDFFSDNFSRVIFDPSQITAFVRNHKNWLRGDCCATFFLFRVHTKLFVARVHVYAKGPIISIDSINDTCLWCARDSHRIVVMKPEFIEVPHITTVWKM